MKAADVTIRMHGVRVDFSSDFEPLNSFARSHFTERQTGTPLLTDSAAIEARLEWIEEAPPRREYAEFHPGKVRLDRDIEMGKGEIVWTRIDDFSDLQLRFLLAESRLRLTGQHFFFLSRKPLSDQMKKAWYRKRLPTLRKKRFSTILYYMIYYPTFWWLERQGLFPLHAAAVEMSGTGIVFCGLPGCGKSTLSLASLALPGARLLSDNIIFFDREKVWSCPEPVLVDEQSLELIGNAGSLLRPLGRQHAFGRSWCHVDPDRLVDQILPRLFFFVGLGEKTSLRALSVEEACHRFASANWIAQEMRRYLVYRSVLGLSGANGLHPDNGEQAVLRALLNRGRSYELTVGWGRGFQEALDQVGQLSASVRI
jgi:hypothetical protein